MEHIIQMENIHKQFEDKVNPTLAGVNLSVRRGEYISMSGVPGSGKTTLLRILALQQQADGGRYLLDGRDIKTLPPETRNSARGGLFATLFFDDSLAEVKEYAPRNYVELSETERIERAAEILKMLNGYEKAEPTSKGCNVKMVINEQKLKFALAAIISADPDVILVDEPPGMMTPRSVRVMMDCLRDMNRDYGTTVILATNNPEIADEADRSILLSEGRVFSDTQTRRNDAVAIGR